MNQPYVLIVTELGVLLVVAVALGHLAQRLGLPAIAGQLLAGVLLGKTVLGAAFPHVFATLFPTVSIHQPDVLKDFLQVGLLLFILCVGLEVELGTVRQRLGTIVPISAFGLAIPFAAGFASVLLLPKLWRGPMPDQPLALACIIGVALAISALPVIASIITDLGLIRTEVGQMILSSAVIDDLCGWIGFAAIAAAFTPSMQQTQPVWEIILIIISAFALTLTLGRRLAFRAAQWLEHHPHPRYKALMLSLTLGLTLVAAALMEGVGAHAFFGALLLGLAFSSDNRQLFEPVERVVRSFFAPLYFGAVALHVDFLKSFDLTLIVVVLLIACTGKLVGVTIGSQLGGCSLRDSLAIASGMNARGAVEILLASLAKTFGLINDRIFVAVVLMALVTSILAGFLIQAILRVKPPAQLVKATVPVLQRLDLYGRPVEEIEIGPRLTIGRDWSNRLALPDDELVSREHALVRQVDGRFRIEDLGSKNGTLIWHDSYWRQVMLDDVQDGDIVVIGKNVFRFSRGARALAETEPVPGASARA